MARCVHLEGSTKTGGMGCTCALRSCRGSVLAYVVMSKTPVRYKNFGVDIKYEDNESYLTLSTLRHRHQSLIGDTINHPAM